MAILFPSGLQSICMNVVIYHIQYSSAVPLFACLRLSSVCLFSCDAVDDIYSLQ